MPEDTNLSGWFAVARSAHFMACLLILSVFVFDRWIVGPAMGTDAHELRARWRTIAARLLLLAFPVALLSGAMWFFIVAMEMSGLAWREAVGGDVLRVVWSQTHFGQLWRLRALAALALLPAIPFVFSRRAGAWARWAAVWAALLLSAALAGSLAWAGHGQTGGPPGLHLAADVVHLVVSAPWPAGLLPFALLLISLRRNKPAEWQISTGLLIRRFSLMALLCVGLLIVTGVANSIFLVGSIPAMTSTPYGLVLVAKILGFAAMIGFGAVNLLRLMPRLERLARQGTGDSSNGNAAARLLSNVVAEVVLAAIVFILVGLLGLLPPPAEHHAHQHHHEEPQSL